LAAEEIIAEEVDGSGSSGAWGAGEVDEVAVVADDVLDVGFESVAVPEVDLLLCEWWGVPLSLVFGEDLDAVDVEVVGLEECVLESAADGEVAA
jgi:hypothetical protein